MSTADVAGEPFLGWHTPFSTAVDRDSLLAPLPDDVRTGGSLVGGGPVRQPPQEAGRRCSSGCGTILSRWNRTEVCGPCAVHARLHPAAARERRR